MRWEVLGLEPIRHRRVPGAGRRISRRLETDDAAGRPLRQLAEIALNSPCASSGLDWPDVRPRGSVRGAASPSNLYEMRPVRSTPAHQTSDFAELVCSNSLKSDSENTAPWLLKEEMRRAGSLLDRNCARVLRSRRPRLGRGPRRLRRTCHRGDLARASHQRHSEKKSRKSRKTDLTIIATGPLTSDALSDEIARLSTTQDGATTSDTASCTSTIPSARSWKRTPSTCRGLPRRPLRQGHSRLHQLPDDRKRSMTVSMMRCSRRSRSKSAIGRS